MLQGQNKVLEQRDLWKEQFCLCLGHLDFVGRYCKISGKKYRTYAIVGDGESQEGQVWEALMLAGAKRLTRFTVIIDNNKMQIDGTTDEVCKVEPFESKLRAFGFKVYTVDGHNIEAATPIIFASAIPQLIKRLGKVSLNLPVPMQFIRSASSTTILLSSFEYLIRLST